MSSSERSPSHSSSTSAARRIEAHRPLGDQQQVLLAHLVIAQPRAGDEAFGGSPPSGSVTARADNTTNGLVLDRLHLAVPEADIGGLRFTHVGFDYAASGSPDRSCPRDWWKATASVFLDGAGFILSPPPSQNGIEFCAGADPFFRSAGGAIKFGGPIPRAGAVPRRVSR